LEVELSNAPAVSSPVGLVLNIYGAEGELRMGEEHDYNGEDGTTRLSRRVYLPEAGDYYITVHDHGDNSIDEAPYQLSLRARPVPDEAAEPNGNSNNTDLLRVLATEIEPGVPTLGYIASEDDDDWFALEIPAESILKLDLDNEPAISSPIDLVCTMMAPDLETRMGEEHDYDGGDETTRLTRNYYVEEAGTYYIHVNDHGGNDDDYDQPFRLTGNLLEVPDADFEPNGNSDNRDLNYLMATPILDGVEIQSFLASKGDEDWFHLEVEGERILELKLNNEPVFNTTLDLIYIVFNAVGERLAEEHNYDGGEGTTYLERNIYLPEAGSYYIRVHDHGDNDYDYDQPFNLNAHLLPVPDGEAEPNGNTDNPDLRQVLATPIADGQELLGFIASEGDDDWYRLNIETAGLLEVSYTNAPAFRSAVDSIVKIFAADAETELAEAHDYDGGDETTLLNLHLEVEPGEYYIQIYDHGGTDYDYDQGYLLSINHP